MTAKPIIDVDIVIEPQDFESTRRIGSQRSDISMKAIKGIPGRDAFDLSDSGPEGLFARPPYVRL